MISEYRVKYFPKTSIDNNTQLEDETNNYYNNEIDATSDYESVENEENYKYLYSCENSNWKIIRDNWSRYVPF